MLSCERPTVGHFSDGGLGPRMTWTHASGIGTELHPFRPIRLLTRVQKGNTRKLFFRVSKMKFEQDLEPKWLLNSLFAASAFSIFFVTMAILLRSSVTANVDHVIGFGIFVENRCLQSICFSFPFGDLP